MGIESLTKKLQDALYKRPNNYILDEATGEMVKNPNSISLEDRINALIESLKGNEKYKNLSEDELRAIAKNQISNGYLESRTSVLNSYVTSTGKPMDPVWGQYTYDEILGMANDGVYVPQEFLDWANAMAASDTTSYELEADASTDPNTVSNLEVNTDDKNDIGKQKKLQKYSSKAEKQEELLIEKSDDLKEQEKNLEVVQSDLEANQKLTLDKINKISEEFKILNAKAQSGEPLSEGELNRYNELGLLLDTQAHELVTQSKNVEADLESLISEMNGVDNLIQVNKEISTTLESMSLAFSGNEGGKRFSYNSSMSGGSRTFGAMEAFAYAAQGQQIASSAGMIGVKLNFDSDELQFKLNTNAAIAELSLNKVQTLNSEAETINSNPVKINNIAQTQEQGAEENAVDGGAAAPALTEGSESTMGAETPIAADGATGAETPIAADGTAETGETTDVENTEGVEETATAGTTGNAEEADPLEVAARDYLNGCALKSSEMQTNLESVKNLRNEVRDIRKSSLRDMLKATAQFKNAFKQYSNLLDKVKKGKDFSSADQAEFLRLNSILDTNNGSIATDMQAKIAVLDGFTASVEAVKSAREENLQYGEAAIQAGKDYAKQEFGDKSDLPKILELSKIGYDQLYGKSGESLGRDAIDSGEALIKQAVSSAKVLMFTKGISGFASEYSARLNRVLEENNAKVAPITQEFNNLLGAKNKQTNGSQKTTGANDEGASNDGSNSNASGNSTNTTRTSKSSASQKEKASQEDVGEVENKGDKAEDQAKEAEKDGKKAVKDKKQCDRDIKKQKVMMKNNSNQIKLLTKDSELANAQLIQLNAQAEAEVASIESILDSPAQDSAPAQEPQAPVSRSMNSVAQVAGADASGGTQTSGISPELSGKVELLGVMSQQSTQIGLRMTSNGKTIKVLENKSVKADKKLAAASKAKQQIAVEEQKAKEQEMKDNQKLTKTVSDIGKLFTATKLAGMGLMMTPWGAAAGLIMFNIGKYGEIASYVTNAAINVAQGNLLGAAINIGSAVLSFLSAPPASAAAKEGVAEAAKNGSAAAAKGAGSSAVVEGTTQVGTEMAGSAAGEAAKSATSEAVKSTAGEAVKSTAGEAVKSTAGEAAKSATGEVAKSATGEVAKSATGEVAKSATGEVAKSAAGEAVKSTAEEAVKNTAEEAIKSTTEEAVKSTTEEVAKNTTGAVTQNAGQNMGQNLVAQLPKVPVAGPAQLVAPDAMNKMVQVATKELGEKFAAEAAKTAAKEMIKHNIKVLAKNIALEAGKSVLSTLGEKQQQNGTKQETKRKMFVHFERKKRNAIRRGIQKIKKSYKAR